MSDRARISNLADAKARAEDTAPWDRGDHVEMAERLVRNLGRTGEIVFDDGALYRYSSSSHVFECVEHSVESQIVQGFAGGLKAGEKPRPLKVTRGDVSGAIELAHDRVSQVDFFGDARPGLAFGNSFVEVEPGKITEHAHSSEHRARFVYPFVFVREAMPVRFVAFLAEAFRDDSDASDKIKLLQEYVGISMLGLAPRYQRALVVFGPGANGKGVFTSIVEAAMPAGSCCAIPPQEWGNEYRLALLAGKRLNVVSELPEADMLNSEAFKAVVSGDSMTGRHIRQAPFTFRAVAGHIFAANRLPGTNDQTHGFWRRFLLVEFRRVFEEAEQDLKLSETLIATELPSIVSWFLEGARRALATGYTVPRSSREAIEKWKRQADQVRAFIEEATRVLPVDTPLYEWTTAADLYRAYRAWASVNGHRPLAVNNFGQRMSQIELGSVKTESAWRYPVSLEPRYG